MSIIIIVIFSETSDDNHSIKEVSLEKETKLMSV